MRRVLLLAATLFGAASFVSRASADPVNIRVAWVVPVGNWATMLYEKKDLMTHYGKTYTVEPTHFQSTPTMIAALSVGELDIADLAYSSFGIAVENAGMTDLRIIADEGQDGIKGHTSVNYVTEKDGPVKTVDDLKGHVLGTVAPGAALDIPVRALLRRHGLEDKRDYTMVEVAFPNMLAMMLDRKVDLIPSVNPFALDPRYHDDTRPLFDVTEAMQGPTQTIIWTAHKDFLDKNRAAMVDLFEDAVRVSRFMCDPKNHDEVVQIAARVAKQPPERIGYAFTGADAYRDPDMRPNMAYLQRAIDVTQEAGFLKTKLDVQQYSGLDILDEAIARLK